MSIPLSEDVSSLPVATEQSVLNLLKERYGKNYIYTNSGPVLLAINPYHDLPTLFSENLLQEYCINGNKLPPHAWKTAALAIYDMYRDQSHNTHSYTLYDQSILISGESGAGKTETTKIIMRFLAQIGNVKMNNEDGGNDSLGEVQRKVLQTNPILDAIGNARTVRNDNSSRFGKYVRLLFDHSGELRGASLNTFLLETTRVVRQQASERNFHIFYMICTEQDEQRRSQYHIKQPHSYDYLILCGGALDRRDGVRDDTLYTTFLRSLEVLGAKEKTVDGLLRTVMAVLTVGNSSFSTHTNSAGDVVMNIDAENMTLLNQVSELLGVECDALIRVLTTRSMTVNGEEFTVTLREEQAAEMKDIFAKTLYRTMFEWMIGFLNGTLRQDSNSNYPIDTCGKIGLLDIFGFECLQQNSLEQLLINYANEHLQQQYDATMIEAEQLLYVEEGIDWSFIDFPSALDCIALISGSAGGKKTGMSIIGLLDDACMNAAQGTDSWFVNQVYTNLDSHPRMSNSRLNKAKSEFGVRHYAGVVLYNANDFVAKNKTQFFPLDELLTASSHEFVQDLAKVATTTVTMKSKANTPTHSAVGGKRRMSVMQVSTISNTFCSNVEELLSTIRATRAHYVKCFKPNDKQRKGDFNDTYMSEQLNCGGVLHTIKVTRAGFPVRFSYEEFWSRYYSLMCVLIREALMEDDDGSMNKIRLLPPGKDPNTMPYSEDHIYVEVSQGIDIVIQRLQLAAVTGDLVSDGFSDDAADNMLCIQRGKTLIFLRQNGFLTLEKLNNELLGARVTVIQSTFRMYYIRSIYRKKYNLVRSVQKVFRFQQGMRLFRRRMYLLRKFIRICLFHARRHFKLVHLAKQLQILYARWKIIRKWRPVLRILRTFVLNCVMPARRKAAGKKLASALGAYYRRKKMIKQWKKTVLLLCRFKNRCHRYIQKQMSIKVDLAYGVLRRIVTVYIQRRRLRKARLSACCIQRWVRCGGFRTYVNRQKYIRDLFDTTIVHLQRTWRWKSTVYKSLLKEKERRRIKGLASAEVKTLSPQRDSYAKQSVLHLYGSCDREDQVDAKRLLLANKQNLWAVFQRYVDAQKCIPATEKRFSVGLVSVSNIGTLFRDWGVMPQIMPLAGLNLIVEDVLHEQPKSNSSRRYLSYNNFCRVLLLLAADLVSLPPLPIDSTDGERSMRPVMSIRESDVFASNPLYSPLVGAGLRSVLTTMDRSAGRRRKCSSRSTTVVPAFVGVLGASLPSSHAALSTTCQMSPRKPITVGPMSSEVVSLLRKNEPTLVSLALRYSVSSRTRSYYSLLNDIPTIVISPSKESPGQDCSAASAMRSPSGSALVSSLDDERGFNASQSTSADSPCIYPEPSTRKVHAGARDQARKSAVAVAVDDMYRMLRDFGVCPQHCSKTMLLDICDIVFEDSENSKHDDTLSYDDFVEVLNTVAQNFVTHGKVEGGSTEYKIQLLFNTMNRSSGREKLTTADRNALVIPPLYIGDTDESVCVTDVGSPFRSSRSRPSSRCSTPNRTGAYGHSSRSITPPPVPIGGRSRTPTGRRSIQSNSSCTTPTARSNLRSQTPPPTSRMLSGITGRSSLTGNCSTHRTPYKTPGRVPFAQGNDVRSTSRRRASASGTETRARLTNGRTLTEPQQPIRTHAKRGVVRPHASRAQPSDHALQSSIDGTDVWISAKNVGHQVVVEAE